MGNGIAGAMADSNDALPLDSDPLWVGDPLTVDPPLTSPVADRTLGISGRAVVVAGRTPGIAGRAVVVAGRMPGITGRTLGVVGRRLGRTPPTAGVLLPAMVVVPLPGTGGGFTTAAATDAGAVTLNATCPAPPSPSNAWPVGVVPLALSSRPGLADPSSGVTLVSS